LRGGDGRFHFYLPDAINGANFGEWDAAFANYSGAELRRMLGFQNYKKLVKFADSPELQLEYVRAVPEPGVMGLICAAGWMLVRRRRRA
jgi:hypothetical protein